MELTLTKRQQSLIYLALCEKRRHYLDCIEQCKKKMIAYDEFVKLVTETEELKALFGDSNKIIVETKQASH